MSALTQSTPAAAQSDAAPEKELRPPSYWPFVVPALVVVLAIIIFPWVFTIWMSLNEWKVGSPTTFVGFANYLRLTSDPRFVEAAGHTLVSVGTTGSASSVAKQRTRSRMLYS